MSARSGTAPTADEPADFHKQLLAEVPRLRVYAVSLTRNRDTADDLVQSTIVKALKGRRSYQPGTNLAAWLFRIQRNEFIDSVRQARPTDELDEWTPGMSYAPRQEDAIVMREFKRAFAQLNAAQREALVLSVLGGQKLADIAALAGVSEGTIKSRISRARDELARRLLDEPRQRISAPRRRREAVDAGAAPDGS